MLRLLTIPISHYCEKARWVLDRAGARYLEEPHAPLLHWAATARWARSRTVPVLVTPHGALKDSRDILKHVDGWLDEPDRLLPHDAGVRRDVEELEELFDEQLGPVTRRWAYAWATEDARVFHELVAQGLVGLERRALDAGHGVLRLALRRVFRLEDPGVKERMILKVRRVFDVVEERLARSDGGGGERWLVGGRFTAADLTFASLAAPVLVPPAYGAWLPSIDALPAAMAATIRELRATPAGAHAMRAYEERGSCVMDARARGEGAVGPLLDVARATSSRWSD